MTMTYKKRESGDTIVEVLIAIAVVSLLLTAAFVLTRANLKSIQSSQEHSQAQALVAGQLERLKTIVPDAADTAFATPFCITNANLVEHNLNHCKLASDGSPYTATSDGLPYSVNITYDQSPDGTTSTFTVQATWESATTSGQSNVTMVYRLYKDDD